MVTNANAAAHWNTALSSFAWEDIRDPQGGTPGAQEDDLLASVLNAVLPESCVAHAHPTDASAPARGLPRVTRLYQNIPNPFNPTSRITFDLNRDGPVKLQVFDVAGRRLRTLVDAPMTAGWKHQVTWNGKANSGRPVSSGVYFYRLETRDLTLTRKMIMLR